MVGMCCRGPSKHRDTTRMVDGFLTVSEPNLWTTDAEQIYVFLMLKTRSLSFGRPTALFPRVLNARFASEAGLPIFPHVAPASDLHPCFPGCFPGCFPLGHATSEKVLNQ